MARWRAANFCSWDTVCGNRTLASISLRTLLQKQKKSPARRSAVCYLTVCAQVSDFLRMTDLQRCLDVISALSAALCELQPIDTTGSSSKAKKTQKDELDKLKASASSSTAKKRAVDAEMAAELSDNAADARASNCDNMPLPAYSPLLHADRLTAIVAESSKLIGSVASYRAGTRAMSYKKYIEFSKHASRIIRDVTDYANAKLAEHVTSLRQQYSGAVMALQLRPARASVAAADEAAAKAREVANMDAQQIFDQADKLAELTPYPTPGTTPGPSRPPSPPPDTLPPVSSIDLMSG
jgi:hypothetical protein